MDLQYPRAATAAKMAEVLRACVVADSERFIYPLGGMETDTDRHIAEATHATHVARMVAGSPC